MPLFCNWVASPETPAFFVGIYRLLFSGSLAACFALLFFARLKLMPLITNRLVLALSCLLASGATLCAALAGSGVLSPAWWYASALFAGICAAFMLMALLVTPQPIFDRSSLRGLLPPFVVVAVLAALMTLVSACAPQATPFIETALPLVFFACFLGLKVLDKAQKAGGECPPKNGVGTYRWHYWKNITISTVVTGLCLGLAFQEQFSTLTTAVMGLAFAAGVACAVLVIALVLRFITPTINSFAAARMPLPYLCGYLVLLPFVSTDYQGAMILGITGIWAFSLIFKLDIAGEVSAQFGIERHTTYGEMLTFRLIGLFAGIALSYVFQHFALPLHPSVALAAAFTLATAISFLLTDGKSLPVWQTHGKNNDSVLEKSVRFVATQSNLTLREIDVLRLLARGHSAQHIATELVISFYTAKTHIKRLYGKLDVHSHQELLNKIEGITYLSLRESRKEPDSSSN
ncbi:MAG: helix-turn-helix transcriptional regulator [Coriobacteriales bacterium]|nr:helix-turn-helix transcriptional regulator [Coriobacteriales bacterium]